MIAGAARLPASVRPQVAQLHRNARGEVERLPDRPLLFRCAVGAFLFVLALAVLVGLNGLLRAGGLWGDLSFALIVTTAVFWAFLHVTARMLHRDERYQPLPRALSATLFALVGVPVAVVTWPLGTVVLVLPIVIWGAVTLRRIRRGTRAPALWGAALAGVGLLLIVVAVRPWFTAAERVPRPAAPPTVSAALAQQFRPYLFFDSGEPRYPLDIEDAVEDGRVEICRRAVRGKDCRPVEGPAAIKDSFDYVEVADIRPSRRGGDDRSAYYYHVVRDTQAVFVDYWWFFSRNPSPVAGKVFCGPGLRTPPFTCHDHAGDWEGVTVVLGSCETESERCTNVEGERLMPVAVRYAQHERVPEYAWVDLVDLWRDLRPPVSVALRPVWEVAVLPVAASVRTRPLVFVARNSHASYPVPCFRRCRQDGRGLPEGRSDGAQPWTHNEQCNGCLKPLPVDSQGEAASWNAFSGHWGAQKCILAGAYCDRAEAPRGPSQHERYQNPSGPTQLKDG